MKKQNYSFGCYLSAKIVNEKMYSLNNILKVPIISCEPQNTVWSWGPCTIKEADVKRTNVENWGVNRESNCLGLCQVSKQQNQFLFHIHLPLAPNTALSWTFLDIQPL